MASSSSARGSDASHPAGFERFGPVQLSNCHYTVVESQRYWKVGTPLDGAYCVDMLAEHLKDPWLYSKPVQFAVCKYLHELSSFGKLRMWPDGFVKMSDMFAQRHMKENGTDRRDDAFRISFMNTQLDEGGVRFKIVCLPQRKEWKMPPGIQKFDDKPCPRVERKGRTMNRFSGTSHRRSSR